MANVGKAVKLGVFTLAIMNVTAEVTKLLDNHRESGITREYPRYGKEIV